MKTNKIMKSLFALLAGSMLAVSGANAQNAVQNNNPAPPPPPLGNGVSTPPPPPANGLPVPPPSAAMPPASQPLQTVTTYKGTVVKMAANDDYMYDGFYMTTNSDSLLVKFPPHLGTQITSAVKAGATVSVNGVMHITPMGTKEVRMLSVSTGGKEISDTAARSATPPSETYVSGNGKITELQTNREGMISGFIIDGKTILRIPPHLSKQLDSLVKVNAGVAYTGMKKPVNNGEVSAAQYSIVHCKTITINGSQYFGSINDIQR